MKVLSRLVVLIAAILLSLSPIIATANGDLGWMTDDISLTDGNNSEYQRKCSEERFTLVSWSEAYGVQYLESRGCVAHGSIVDTVTGSSLQSSGRTYQTYAVRPAGEQYFYLLHLDYIQLNLVGNTDIAYQVKSNPQGSYSVKLYKNLSDALVISKKVEGQAIEYSVDLQKNYISHDINSAPIAAHTADGLYVTGTERNMLWKLNTSTGFLRRINLSNPLNKPIDRVGAISSEGRYVFIPSLEAIVDTDGSCIQPEYEWAGAETCPHRDVRSIIEPMAGSGYRSGEAGFVQNGYALELYTIPGNYTYLPITITLSLPAASAPSGSMKYMALGDSYTSGEGDLAKQSDGSSFYLPGTDQDGQCHLGSRSYPFLLRNSWSVSTDLMKSVACSGALVTKDYYADPLIYKGQHNELYDKSDNEAGAVKQEAITGFAPGVIPQLEFVKKYKPSAVTVTGGGNDVGFANIIKYCASDIVESGVFDYSCEYIEGGALYEVLNDAIDSQYASMKKMIQEIQAASPRTKIYYIGYPSFIADSAGSCALNNGALNDKERDMMNKAVTRLNDVIKAVAAATQIRYIDIESSLSGGRLCEGSDYITGIWDVGILANNYTQAFHPNADGHQKMANSILESIPNLESTYTPEPPVVRVVKPTKVTHSERMLHTDMLPTGNVLRVNLQPNSLLGSSEVVLTGFSTPAPLGIYSSRQDGSLAVETTLPPQMEPGFHVLLLEGKAPSGEAIRLYQQFTVTSSDLYDIDGDGIKNDDDVCSFMKTWFNSVGKDVCVLAISTDTVDSGGEVSRPPVILDQAHQAASPVVMHASDQGSLLFNEVNTDYSDKYAGLVPQEALSTPSLESRAPQYSNWANVLWISAIVGGTLCGMLGLVYLRKK